MIKKTKLYKSLLLLLVVLIAAAAIAVYMSKPASSLPTSAQWNSAISTSTPQILAGTVTALGSGSLTLSVEVPPGLGSTTVIVGNSTPITKNTPKSPTELAAAFKEFQKEQAAAGGKSFTPPSASDVTPLSFSDLKVGDSVLVTLTPGSTKGSFTAQSVAVVPAGQVTGAPSASGTPPPLPQLPALPAVPAPAAK